MLCNYSYKGDTPGYRDGIRRALLLDKRAFAEADLAGADLSVMDFKDVDFSGASLEDASLSQANFTGAILMGTNLLNTTGLTREQLASAKTLIGATMPEAITLRDENDVEQYLRSMQSTQS